MKCKIVKYNNIILKIVKYIISRMLQCTGLSSLFKPLTVASLMYMHSVPLVLFRLGVCCCLRRDIDARNGSGRVLRGGGRNHEVKLSMCAVGEQLPTMLSVS